MAPISQKPIKADRSRFNYHYFSSHEPLIQKKKVIKNSYKDKAVPQCKASIHSDDNAMSGRLISCCVFK